MLFLFYGCLEIAPQFDLEIGIWVCILLTTCKPLGEALMFGFGRKKGEVGRDDGRSLQSQSVSYFDAVRNLAIKLSRSIPLSEWATEMPRSYNLREIESINATQQACAKLAYTTASRYVEEPLQLLLSEIGLVNLARELKMESYADWGDDLPAEALEPIVSAYLKAWLCNSNPFVLLELADSLTSAGKLADARAAVIAALLFPAYATSQKANECELVAQSIVWELLPSGPVGWDSRSLSQGLYSSQSLALLGEEAERIQQHLN